jgi:gluconate kinase
MKLFVFFGLPATGKTFIGNIAQKYFGYHIYHGDSDMPPELFQAIQNQQTVTDDMRDSFFTNLISRKNIASNSKKHFPMRNLF